MSTPLVVSRIQNRRGLQNDFNALYPTYPGTGPNVLQPGEIALCTDSGRVFMGTTIDGINGYYIDITGSGTVDLSNIVLTPVVTILTPSLVWANVLPPIIETPFFTLLYSVIDAITSFPNTVGTSFSKNGELKITSTSTAATLVDTSTEINATAYYINFSVIKTGSNIQLQYMHNFPASVTFSTSSIIWLSI